MLISQLLAQPSVLRKIASCDQVGCQRSFPENQIKGTETQGTAPTPSAAMQPGHRPDTPLGLRSLDLVFGKAALAADLVKAWNFTESGGGYRLAADLFTASFLAIVGRASGQKMVKISDNPFEKTHFSSFFAGPGPRPGPGPAKKDEKSQKGCGGP